MIGALRESVTKVLDEFQRIGLVELSRGRVIVRDVAQGCKPDWRSKAYHPSSGK